MMIETLTYADMDQAAAELVPLYAAVRVAQTQAGDVNVEGGASRAASALGLSERIADLEARSRGQIWEGHVTRYAGPAEHGPHPAPLIHAGLEEFYTDCV